MADSIIMKTALCGALALGLAVSPLGAQDGVDEVIVTGSYIKQTPEDAPVPVDVVNSEELFNVGNPSVVELVKTLGVSSGVDGETNQFQSNGLEGTANINLRGLGPGRNLVLLNGKRNVFAPYHVATQAQLFVDINNIPAVALDRIELLKDGAAATYGSDAISGVVNFITRDDYEGVEFALSHKEIQDSDGDQDFGIIAGQSFGATHIMAAVGYNVRNQLQVRDRDWAVSPFLEGGIIRGYSLSPNPGGFLDHHRYLDGPDGIREDDPLTVDDPNTDEVENNEAADNPSAIGIPASALAGLNAAQDPYGYVDPFCAQHAGTVNFARLSSPAFAGGTLRNRCTYNYTYFDNLIEEEERINLFSVLTHEFDDSTLKVEFLFADNEVPEWHTSPSYPPQVNFDTRTDTGRYIYADHPGLEAFAQIDMDDGTAGIQNDFLQYVGDGNWDGTGTPVACTTSDCSKLLFYGRPFGVSGPPTIGSREYETIRLAATLDGTFDSGVDYTTSLSWSTSEGTRTSFDVLSERWSEALRGYGVCGVDDDGTPGGTAGQGDCEYYNPFSNSIRVSDQKFAVYTAANPNPNYPNADNGLDATPGAGIVNSDRLREWLFEGVGTEVENGLVVWDGVISGEARNGVGWAFGAQYREEERTVTPFELTNLHLNPCQSERENIEFRGSGRAYNPDGRNCAGGDGIFEDDAGTANVDESADDYTGSGPYYFLGGTTPFDGDQSITGIFGELAIQATDNIDLQLSARYEDYGGDVGDSFDPKVAVRWQVTDQLVLRGSASSTFRGPTLNQLSGRTTTLSLVSAAGNVYKAIDTFGTADLDPESADTLNLGALFDIDGIWNSNDTFSVSADYWSFDFSDPVVVESYNDIVTAAFSGEGGLWNPESPFADRITCGGPCAGQRAVSLERVRVDITNGPDIETDGFDIAINYNRPIYNGDLDLSLQLTHVMSYDVGALAPAEAFDGLGKVNNKTSLARPIVENKVKLGAQYTIGSHLVNFVTNHTSGYLGTYGAGNTEFATENHQTYDLHYNLSLAAVNPELEDSAVWVSFYNLTDEDPPLTPLDLNYDPYTHNPFGQMIKVGVRHKF